MLPIQKKIVDLLEAGYLLLDQKTGVIQLSDPAYALVGQPPPKHENLQSLTLVEVKQIRKRVRKAKSDDTRLEQLIVDYLSLWPEKVMSGGRLVKQGPAAIRKKFAPFLKRHPEFTDTQILNAATKYISKAKQVNYGYMTCSDYFIEKNGASQLEAAILALQASITSPERKSIYERTV
jgi:hypothetical protein